MPARTPFTCFPLSCLRQYSCMNTSHHTRPTAHQRCYSPAPNSSPKDNATNVITPLGSPRTRCPLGLTRKGTCASVLHSVNHKANKQTQPHNLVIYSCDASDYDNADAFASTRTGKAKFDRAFGGARFLVHHSMEHLVLSDDVRKDVRRT